MLDPDPQYNVRKTEHSNFLDKNLESFKVRKVFHAIGKMPFLMGIFIPIATQTSMRSVSETNLTPQNYR